MKSRLNFSYSELNNLFFLLALHQYQKILFRYKMKDFIYDDQGKKMFRFFCVHQIKLMIHFLLRNALLNHGSFIVTFSNKVPDSEKDSAAVQEFLANMEAAFRAHSLWAGCSEEELESAGEVSFSTVILDHFWSTRSSSSFG